MPACLAVLLTSCSRTPPPFSGSWLPLPAGPSGFLGPAELCAVSICALCSDGGGFTGPPDWLLLDSLFSSSALYLLPPADLDLPLHTRWRSAGAPVPGGSEAVRLFNEADGRPAGKGPLSSCTQEVNKPSVFRLFCYFCSCGASERDEGEFCGDIFQRKLELRGRLSS